VAPGVNLAQALFSPRAVALIGASGDATKNTARPQRYLKKHGYAGKVFPVNPTRSEIFGVKACRRASEIPEPVEHAYILIEDVEQALEECGKRGIAVASIFSGGFADAGAAGMERQKKLVARAKELGMRLLGPNSMGVIVPGSLAVSVNAVLEMEALPAGATSIVSQSGTMLGTLLSRGAARGLGFAKLVSVGNEADIGVGELVELLGKPQNLVSYHLAELRRAGIVSSRRSSADGRDVYYRADLFRCRDLLGEAGLSLHPGLSVAPSMPHEGGYRRPRPRLLFLCTGNSARSQIAEALVERRSAGAVGARSAGSHPKALHPNAVRVMAERGIDISGRPTKSLSRFVRTRFDRVITLCDKVREICPEFPGAPVAAHWSIADPASAGDDDQATYPAFEQVAEEIDSRVALLLDDLRTRQEERIHHG
jgi:protein-tyrosine-phosphatase